MGLVYSLLISREYSIITLSQVDNGKAAGEKRGTRWMWRVSFGNVVNKDPHVVTHKLDCTT